MKKQTLFINDLIHLDFRGYKQEMEDGGYYHSMKFEKNNSEITVVLEFLPNNEFLDSYVEFNGEILEGKNITKSDIIYLKSIM